MVRMSEQCEICGRFSSQVSEKPVRLRGLDNREGRKKVEIDVSDVFAGECCGSEVLANPESYRREGTYQRYLNGAGEGSVRFVLLVGKEVEGEPMTVQQKDGKYTTKEVEIEVDGYRSVPVQDRDLPHELREWFVGKIGPVGWRE